MLRCERRGWIVQVGELPGEHFYCSLDALFIPEIDFVWDLYRVFFESWHDVQVKIQAKLFVQDALGLQEIFQLEDVINTPGCALPVHAEKQVDSAGIQIALVINDMSEKLFLD